MHRSLSHFSLRHMSHAVNVLKKCVQTELFVGANIAL